jgi:FixJ family two-component response regulator
MCLMAGRPQPISPQDATSASSSWPTAKPHFGLMLNVEMPKGLVVSIVDDDSSVSEGLQDLLNSMGLIADTFRCADDFLKSDRLNTTSCLIADVQMPGMSGLALHDHLMRAGRRVPTILTAFPRDADRAHAMRTGVHCCLPKPFSEEDLLACIRSTFASPAAGGGD